MPQGRTLHGNYRSTRRGRTYFGPSTRDWTPLLTNHKSWLRRVLFARLGQADEALQEIGLLRAGDEISVTVTAVKREKPLAHQVEVPLQRLEQKDLTEILKHLTQARGDKAQLMLVHPPTVGRLAYGAAKLGDGKPSIPFRREADKDVKITVERDGKKWEVDEKSIGMLPPRFAPWWRRCSAIACLSRQNTWSSRTYETTSLAASLSAERLQEDDRLKQVLKRLEQLRRDVNKRKSQIKN